MKGGSNLWSICKSFLEFGPSFTNVGISRLDSGPLGHSAYRMSRAHKTLLRAVHDQDLQWLAGRPRLMLIGQLNGKSAEPMAEVDVIALQEEVNQPAPLIAARNARAKTAARGLRLLLRLLAEAGVCLSKAHKSCCFHVSDPTPLKHAS